LETAYGIYVSGFEILNEGRNVEELGLYAHQILTQVRSKWYPRIPDLQKSIGRERGTTSIELEISKDGSVRKMRTVVSAGDVSLDSAASEAISSSAPFALVPEAYHQKTLKLRMQFGYDQPASATAPFCDGPNRGAHPTPYALHKVGDGVTPPRATYAPDPEYSEQARKGKYMSAVSIAGTVDPQGTFTDLCVSQGAGAGLDEKAMEAIKTWKFEPATLRGQPVATRINVEVTFRLY
jgi:TonB family protein